MSRRRWLLALLLLALAFPLFLPGEAPGLAPYDLAGPDSQFVNVDGIDVHVTVSGQGNPVIVMLHGFGASTVSFEPIIPMLAATSTVVAYDRPAFGLTERPHVTADQPDPYAASYQPRLLAGLLDNLGYSEAILMGHSAGGAVALDFLATYPERVMGLVLIAPAERSRSLRLPSVVLRAPWIRRPMQLALRLFFRVRGQAAVESAWHNPERIPAGTLDGYQRALQIRGWDRALWDMSTASASDSYRDRTSVPTIVIAGRYDRIVPLDRVTITARGIPGADLIVIDDCGHLPHEEMAGEFLEVVVPFIERIAGDKYK